LNKTHEDEVYINPVVRKPRALRSVLPVLVSRPARIGSAIATIYPFKHERATKKPC